MSITAMKQALEALEAVLCSPEGKCCIQGSDMDRLEVDMALATFRQAIKQYEKQKPVGVVYSVPVGQVVGPDDTLKFAHTVLSDDRLLLNQSLYHEPQPQQKPEYKMNDEKLLRLALEAIERGVRDGYWNKDTVDVSTAIQKRLFQPTPQPQQAEKQEPVGWYDREYQDFSRVQRVGWEPIYTAPQPQRERVIFPTMLRKMWSGGEVQAWLDENVNKEKNA